MIDISINVLGSNPFDVLILFPYYAILIKIARRKEINTNKKISSYHYMNNFTASIVKLIQSDLNMADLTVDTRNYRPL